MVSYVEVGGKGLAAEEKPAQVTLAQEGGQLRAEDHAGRMRVLQWLGLR